MNTEGILDEIGSIFLDNLALETIPFVGECLIMFATRVAASIFVLCSMFNWFVLIPHLAVADDLGQRDGQV
ncbi:MAG: hypothetical protein JNL67_04650 [Planctomycetaceae bacterium]|nr:hypothetical protein [Planctomycetaceae bacterium]